MLRTEQYSNLRGLPQKPLSKEDTLQTEEGGLGKPTSLWTREVQRTTAPGTEVLPNRKNALMRILPEQKANKNSDRIDILER